MNSFFLAVILVPVCFAAGYLVARMRDRRVSPPGIESEIVSLLRSLRQLETRSSKSNAARLDFLARARALIVQAIEESRAPCLTSNRSVYFRRALISEYLMKARQELKMSEVFEE